MLRSIIAQHHIKIKFILVGIWNTIFGYGIFIALDYLFEQYFSNRQLAYMLAMLIAQIVGIINAFIFHKYITFQSQARGKKNILEFAKFCLTYVVTFLLSLSLLPILVEMFTLQPRIAAIFIILICTIISYLGHKHFSFS
jgi:putative flippase GtrA